MILPPVFELTIVGVVDPGVPNQERIILRPTETVNLGQFGMILGRRTPEGLAMPLPDHFFWFGEAVVAPPSWIVLYTGGGQFQQTKIPESGDAAYVFHWGKQYTLFQEPHIIPLLFRFGGVLLGGVIPNAVPAISKGRR